jgi:hypothetical protein
MQVEMGTKSALLWTTRRGFAKALTGISTLAYAAGRASGALDEGFRNPPDAAKPWTYWWWLNGYVTREGIVRDLEEMKRQGIAGVLVFNAGGGPTPKSIAFMSPEWRELFRFASEEAGKRNIAVSVDLCSGWNAGGPWVKAEDAAQALVFSEAHVRGPRVFEETLAVPSHRDSYYRDIAVLT